MPIIRDALPEPDEEFELVLDDPTGEATVGPPMRVQILDDEPTFRSVTHGDDGWVNLELRAPPRGDYSGQLTGSVTLTGFGTCGTWG